MGYSFYSPQTTQSADPEKILWKWNGIDYTQFGDGAGNPTATIGSPTGTGLSVTQLSDNLDCPRIPILSYAHDAVAVPWRAYFMVNDLPELPNKYIIEARMGPTLTGTLGQNTYPYIIPVWQSSARCCEIYRNSQYQAIRSSNGSTDVSLGCAGNFYSEEASPEQSEYDEGRPFRLLCDMRDPDGVSEYPGFRIISDVADEGGSKRAVYSSDWGAYGGGTCFSSSWHSDWLTGGTIKNFGFGFGNGACGAGSAYVADLLIREWVPVGG